VFNLINFIELDENNSLIKQEVEIVSMDPLKIAIKLLFS
jgi:hypothetical protein